ncbi:MAG: Do family serine endopeptidase [Planctomycetaceae bacterium]|nr:Do family serine endopeptidase [Planctomycetaceae bacterium]
MRCSSLRVRSVRWAFLLFAVAAFGSLGVLGGAARERAMGQTPAVATDPGAVSYARSLSKAFREVAEKVLPSVVMIRCEATPVETPKADDDSDEPNPFGDALPPEFRKFFKDMPRMPHGMIVPRGRQSSVGSGVIVDPSGVILTNHHVVREGGKITVRLRDGREFEATEIKSDPKTDLAIVRIKGAGKLVAAKFGNSDEMQVGDWVLALGDPFGLEGSVTAGIVSAKGRGLENETRASFIQTDAAINPGNSGGPLVNLDGEIVGINRAIASNTGGYQGVGFAISSNLAQWVSQQLIASGTVKRGFLGIGIQPVEQKLAEKFGVRTRQGVVVSEVRANTPASEAGLKPGDIVLQFAGKSIDDPKELQEAVDQSTVGQKYPVEIVRNGKRMTIDVTPREQPANYGMSGGESLTPGPDGTVRDEKLGVSVGKLTPEVAEKLGVKPGEGVVITDVRAGSPAQSVGLAEGMVITQIDQKPVKSVDDFRTIMEKQSLAKGVLLLVRTSQGSRFVVIQSR